MKKNIIAAAAALLCTLPLGAQTSTDLGSWGSLQLVKSWKGQERPQSPAPYAMARFEHRSFQNVSATECYFLMAGGGCAFNKNIKADLSYEYWTLPASGNINVHKGVAAITGSLASGPLAVSLREKYELAYTPTRESMTHTLRSRLRAQYSVCDKKLTPYMMYEFFNGLTDGNWIRSLHYAGMECRISSHSSIDIFYMYHMFDSKGVNAAEHVAGIGYNLSL